MKIFERMAAGAGVAALVIAGTLSLGTTGTGASTTTGTFQTGSVAVISNAGTLNLTGFSYSYSTTRKVRNTWTNVPMRTTTLFTITVTIVCTLTGRNMPTTLSFTCSGKIQTGVFTGCNVTNFLTVSVSHDPPPPDLYKGSSKPTFSAHTCTAGNTAQLNGRLYGQSVTLTLYL